MILCALHGRTPRSVDLVHQEPTYARLGNAKLSIPTVKNSTIMKKFVKNVKTDWKLLEIDVSSLN